MTTDEAAGIHSRLDTMNTTMGKLADSVGELAVAQGKQATVCEERWPRLVKLENIVEGEDGKSGLVLDNDRHKEFRKRFVFWGKVAIGIAASIIAAWGGERIVAALAG